MRHHRNVLRIIRHYYSWWNGQKNSEADRKLDQFRLRPYRFSFASNNTRYTWIRFYRDMETALQDSKAIALREFKDAHNFMVESDQNDVELRKSWGLDF